MQISLLRMGCRAQQLQGCHAHGGFAVRGCGEQIKGVLGCCLLNRLLPAQQLMHVVVRCIALSLHLSDLIDYLEMYNALCFISASKYVCWPCCWQ